MSTQNKISRNAPNLEQQFAVLTGDIITSSALSPDSLESVRKVLLESTEKLNTWAPDSVAGNAEFFRGDAWQLVINKPATALRAAIFIRASLIATMQTDTRVSIGLGCVDTIDIERVSLSTGEAFRLSGHGLDKMTQYHGMSVKISQSFNFPEQWISMVSHLCDSLIRSWTQRQSQIVSLAIVPEEPTHQEIARSLLPAISKQAVSKALQSANWYVIRESIHLFEQTIVEGLQKISD